jgi:hypothetical protein
MDMRRAGRALMAAGARDPMSSRGRGWRSKRTANLKPEYKNTFAMVKKTRDA